ncbi:hypothetical protein OHA72_27130 [Dactylosporangium sp. NBC_01737]|uniref:hypothetical protein n=1 Tax=Dactylosporangium sp. NBC_01737 TaxID=2975959 RepID=UPI002E0EEC47|nr:hypothetical protein OHA72_27130 [Dactylosporangium sp. NBC_01737]
MRAAAGEIGDVLALAVQRISGHHDAGQVADLIEQYVEAVISLVLVSTPVLARTPPLSWSAAARTVPRPGRGSGNSAATLLRFGVTLLDSHDSR